ncbi:MAG: hypothetical protein OMM_13893, partial [Candidatus Magnetoglobus multicellularis str. Araruama]
MIGKTFAAINIGEIFLKDAQLINSDDRRKLSIAIRTLVPETCINKISPNPVNDLPILKTDTAPDFAKILTYRIRAGYESPCGGRFQGWAPESQAGHALTTAIIAALLGGTLPALVALSHNAHLSQFPDVPHRIEASIGADVLASLEHKVKMRMFRE